MKPAKTFQDPQPERALKAKLHMACFFLLLVAVHIVEAFVTFPFVGHASKVHNLLYALVITVPLWITATAFILLTRKDLSALKKERNENKIGIPDCF